MCGQAEPWRSEVLGRGFAVSSPRARHSSLGLRSARPLASQYLMEKSLNCGGAGGGRDEREKERERERETGRRGRKGQKEKKNLEALP